MAKTLDQIQKQIDKLQKEAEAIKAREVGSVVARIREAIAHYGLTAKDLFGTAAAKGGKPARAGKGAARKASPRPVGVIKYRDEAGNAWTGHGKRPNWFKAALEAGKKPEELLAK